MKFLRKLNHWLEIKFCAPAYGSWVLAIIALCFFGAATNTLAGWLYVISGVIFALLAVGAILPRQSLRQLQVYRHPISPVSAGENLAIELAIKNTTSQPKHLIAIEDILPSTLGKTQTKAVEIIPPGKTHRCVYYQPTTKRGIYRWQEVQLKTASPLGLFWCRRSWEAKAKAIVYPQVLPLQQCPLVDSLGLEYNANQTTEKYFQAATAGITKSIRPYRTGDPTRLIHWRSSARYGELRVRELEALSASGHEMIICLDSSANWHGDNFETAVIAAASLYFYGWQRQLDVKIWTGNSGIVKDKQEILTVLAMVSPQEEINTPPPSGNSLLWLTGDVGKLTNLPFGSRWLLFTAHERATDTTLKVSQESPGLVINPEQSLSTQLENSPG